MKFSKEEVTEIAGDLLTKDKIVSNPPYEWIDVLGITQRPAKLSQSLYFATHSDGADGWHNAYDRRPTAANVAKDKGWHLAVEPGVEVGDSQHLIVSSLTRLSERMNLTRPERPWYRFCFFVDF